MAIRLAQAGAERNRQCEFSALPGLPARRGACVPGWDSTGNGDFQTRQNGYQNVKIDMMSYPPPGNGRLDARLIRRRDAVGSGDHTLAITTDELIAPPGTSWRDDLRLFLAAWAAGFVFFLVFLL